MAHHRWQSDCVPSPSYVPRNYTLDYHDFGRVREIRWVDEAQLDDAELDRLGASRTQHSLSVAINAAIRARFGSRNAYAEANGLNSAALGRMLRGEKPMKLVDVAQANRCLRLGLLS